MSQGTVRRGTRLGTDPVPFRFDGRSYAAQQGDSAASALWAAGVRVLNRSIKYRRPRAFLALGPEDPNALLTVGTAPCIVPNVPAAQLTLTDGLVLTSQNRWPSLRFDLAALCLGAGASLWSAGFYYKTFMWPSWRTYEGMIRRLAGLGYAPGASNLPDTTVHHRSADVVIAGGGAAGLVCALQAARSGLRVTLLERSPVLGGELEFETATIDDLPAREWLAQAEATLHVLGVSVLRNTALISIADGLAIAHEQPSGMPGADTLHKLHAPTFVNAMGSVERGIAFIDNDRPGVMLTGAAERLVACYGVAPGSAVVLFGCHDRLYATAQRLIASGVTVRAVVDTRQATGAAGREALQAQGIECLLGHAVVAARGTPVLRSVSVVALDAPAQSRTIRCDALLVGGGWTPYVYSDLQQGGRPTFRAELGAFVATDQPAWRCTIGAAAGHLDLRAVVADAHAMGLTLAESAGRRLDAALAAPRVTAHDGTPALEPYYRSPAARRDEKRQFVDPQNDVTVADLRQAIAEGFVDIEHIKRYTTLGIGTEQGRTGGTLGAAIVAELRDLPQAVVTPSRSRGPFQPVPMHVLRGHRTATELRPGRRTALHDLHLAAGAELELMSGWLRPRFYTANGVTAAAASVVEARRVRAEGGICDASTLGKIEIAGPDAATFLDRLYLGRPSTLGLHRARYAVLLREDGMVLDDGLMLRCGHDRFLATTSSSHLGHVLSHLEFYRDTECAEQRLAITDLTEAWSVIVVAGPASRDALHEVLGAAFRAPLDALRHMDITDGRWGQYRVRILRASFTGELAYEVHCQPAAAPLLWMRLAGTGLQPFGLEALDVLRVEKGYFTSSELNGQTTPLDVGLERLVNVARSAVGVALLDRPGLTDPERPQLVGLRAADGRASFAGGAQLTADADSVHSVGYVTSAVYSPQLGETVGLALVARRLAVPGQELTARDPIRSGDTPVRIVAPVHFDASNERMKA